MNSSTGTTRSAAEPSSDTFAEFVLKQIHHAKLRAQITVNQIEMAATALSAGMISPEAAILVLAETGVEVSS